jgi:hypothetical protein
MSKFCRTVLLKIGVIDRPGLIYGLRLMKKTCRVGMCRSVRHLSFENTVFQLEYGGSIFTYVVPYYQVLPL